MSTPPDESYFWRNILDVAQEEWSRRNLEDAMKAPPSDGAVRAIEAYKAKKMGRAEPRPSEDQLVLREADLAGFRLAEIEAACAKARQLP